MHKRHKEVDDKIFALLPVVLPIVLGYIAVGERALTGSDGWALASSIALGIGLFPLSLMLIYFSAVLFEPEAAEFTLNPVPGERHYTRRRAGEVGVKTARFKHGIVSLTIALVVLVIAAELVIFSS